MQSSTFSFQGKVYLATRDVNGNCTAMVYSGNAPLLKVALTTTVKDHKESTSGQRIIDDRLITEKKCDITLELDNWNSQNLAIAMYGAVNTTAAGTATGELLPTGLVANNYVRLQQPNVSSLVITDSAGTPATLSPATDYNLISANGGIVEILNVGTYVQPFKAAYSYAGSADVNMFSQAAPERWLVFDGINTVNNQPVLVDLYRVRFDPLKELDLVIDDYAKLQLMGSALWDSTKSANAILGQFGRIRTQ